MKLIKAEEMRVAFREAELDYCHNGLPLENVKGWMLEYLDNAPEIQVVPVIHAKWSKYPDSRSIVDKYYQCSNCQEYSTERYKFCPYCGARMDGGIKK